MVGLSTTYRPAQPLPTGFGRLQMGRTMGVGILRYCEMDEYEFRNSCDEWPPAHLDAARRGAAADNRR